MSRGVNKVIIVGHLGGDPEVRATASGARIANITVATSDSWTDKTSGQKQERVEWHKVVFFNRLAEIVEQYLTKGSQVYVEGRLQTRKWQDKDGADRWSTEIVASEMQMLGSKSGGQSNGQSAPPPGRNTGTNSAPAQQQNTGGPDINFDDDIPF